MVVGLLALVCLVLLDPIKFPNWVSETFMGIIISTLFFNPISKLIEGRKQNVGSVASLFVGLVVFVAYSHLKGWGIKESVEFLLEWISTFAFISVLFQELIQEFKKV